VFLTAAPEATGAWQVTLDVPSDFPEGDATIVVQCGDTMGQQPSWGRVLQTSIGVVAGPEQPTTTPRTTPNTLARTGLTSGTSLVRASLLLIVLGVSALVLAAPRRRSAIAKERVPRRTR
jgi:hypothetical protein